MKAAATTESVAQTAPGSTSESESESESEPGAGATAAPLVSADQIGAGRCTGFASMGLVGQTVDLPPPLYAFGDADCVLRLRSASGGCIAYDVDGRLCPIGVSDVGLCVTVFNLHLSHTAGFDAPSALTVQTLAWELLLGRYTLDGALHLLKHLKAPMMCGAAMLLGDASGSALVELSYGEVACITSTVGPLFRTNHPLVDSLKLFNGNGRKEQMCSDERLAQLRAQFAKQESRFASDGAEDLADLLGSSKKVCHAGTLATIACDARKRRLVVDFKERFPAKGGGRIVSGRSVSCKIKRTRYVYEGL